MALTATVIAVHWRTEGIFELILERNGVAFTPGDCVALFAADGQASRPYSLASGTDDDTLRFLIRAMPGGEVSPYLGGLQPGDEVKLSPPFGWFRPGGQGAKGPSVFFATGTGIAPFMAYFRSPGARPPMRCYYGVRWRADAMDVDWLRDRCDVRLAVSREAASDAYHGRITDLLDDCPIESQAHYYLCGLDSMIDEISVWLEGQGIDLSRIHRECFFNAEP